MSNSRIVRNWIKQFSDQKLAEVYAFNQDGKMSFMNPCACLLGVTLADRLHVSPLDCRWRPGQPWESLSHYSLAKAIPGASAAELAYLRLGFCDWLTRWRFSRILKAEMRERERVRMDRRRKCAVEQVAPLRHPETAKRLAEEARYDHSLL